MRNHSMAAMVGLFGLTGSGLTVSAQTAAPGEAWRSSPFHGAINGATGKPIPCICRFQGQDYRLGASVCMQTHVGVVVTRCDLSQNNTTWMPTNEACVISQQTTPQPKQFAATTNSPRESEPRQR